MKRHLSRPLMLAAILCASLFPAPPANALFHLMKITEVFGGTTGQPTAQFIEMQMHAANQRFVTSHEIVVFDAAGEEKQTYTFASPVANGDNQAHVLIATAEAEAMFEVTADLQMTPEIVSSGGRACFRDSGGALIDCASWGSYDGDDTDSGTPFNSPVGLVAGQSMERDTSGGSDPQALDAEDDTNNSSADFELAAPSPTNNAGAGAGGGGEEPETHERSVTLRLRDRANLVARGKVTADDGFARCAKAVPVKIQKRKDGVWRTIESATTRDDGTYSKRIPKRNGTYRTRATAVGKGELHRCAAATSPTRTR